MINRPTIQDAAFAAWSWDALPFGSISPVLAGASPMIGAAQVMVQPYISPGYSAAFPLRFGKLRGYCFVPEGDR